jgi:hypothetical protein
MHVRILAISEPLVVTFARATTNLTHESRYGDGVSDVSRIDRRSIFTSAISEPTYIPLTKTAGEKFIEL